MVTALDCATCETFAPESAGTPTPCPDCGRLWVALPERPARSARAEASRNERGSSEDRRRRKAWLVEAYRADMDFAPPLLGALRTGGVPIGQGVPACRCYRCGHLLTVDTVTPDRIKPGCQGGTYKRENLRPACGPCNTETGARLGAARRQKGKR